MSTTTAEISSELFRHIVAGDQEAEAELVERYYAGVCCVLRRRMRQWDVFGVAQDVFVRALTQLRRGDLKAPEALAGFIRTVAVRQADEWMTQGSRCQPQTIYGDLSLSQEVLRSIAAARFRESYSIVDQKEAGLIMASVLAQLRPVESEALRRWFCNHEVSSATICSELNISEEAFLVAKSRAKSMFAEKMHQAS